MSIPTGASEHACNPFTELSNSDPVKSLHEMYELFKVDWNGSTAGKAVAKTLDERVISRKDIEITEALCLGVGELNNRRTSFRERSLGQLAIFACVLDILSKFDAVSLGSLYHSLPETGYGFLPLTDSLFFSRCYVANITTRISISNLQDLCPRSSVQGSRCSFP